MAVGTKALALALLLPFLLLVPAVGSQDDDRVADLLRRQAGAADGVIALDDAATRHFAASPDRPYALLVFFDALQLRDRSDLRLEELRSEFGLLAKAYIKNNAGGDGESKMFFCSLEFQASQASFAAFGVNSLPHIRFLPPGSSLPDTSEVMDVAESARSAETMAAFLRSKIKHQVGTIDRPPFLSKKQLLLIVVGLLLAAPYALKKLLIDRDTPFNSSKVWCVGALLIYFFSVSGGMHNIIRKMPLFMTDRQNPNKLVFFYQGSGMQLGAEGFAVGYLYLVVGLVIAFITHLLVAVKSKLVQRLVMLLGMTVCFWSVRKVVLLDAWKTGYAVHAYLPKAWH